MVDRWRCFVVISYRSSAIQLIVSVRRSDAASVLPAAYQTSIPAAKCPVSRCVVRVGSTGFGSRFLSHATQDVVLGGAPLLPLAPLQDVFEQIGIMKASPL